MKKTFIYIIIIFNTFYLAHSQNQLSIDDINFRTLFSDAIKYYVTGNNEISIEKLDKAQKIYKNNPNIFFLYGKNYLALKNYDFAIHNFKKAINLDNSNIWYKFYLAKTLELNNQTEQALELYTQILKNFNNDKLYFKVINLYDSLNMTDLAIKTAENLKLITGLTPRLTYTLLKLYKKTNNNDKYIDLLKQAVLENPNIEYYQNLLINYYVSKGYNSKLIKFFKENNLNIENYSLYNTLVSFYLNNNKIDSAKFYFYKLMKLYSTPNEIKVSAIIKLSPILPEQETINYFKKIYKQEPENLSICNAYYNFLIAKNRLYELKTLLSKCYKYYPNNIQVLKNLALLYLKFGQLDSLLIISQNAIEIYPNITEFYIYLAIANIHLKKFQKANYFLSIAKTLSWDNNINLTKIEFLTQLSNNNLNESILYTDNCNLLFFYAYTLIALNSKYQKDILKHLNICNNSAELIYIKAKILINMGEINKAKTIIQNSKFSNLYYINKLTNDE